MGSDPHGVLGYGRTGASVARALAEEGGEAVVWDDSRDARKAAAAAGFEVRPLDISLTALVASPGIASSHPAILSARDAGISVIGDVEIFWRRREADGSRFLAVSGTNGKSTVTALVAHVLAEAEIEVAAGGNLGPPALEMPRLDDGGVYALELSSYQLDLLDRFRADVAVLLNIGEDHLDRHGGHEGYVAAKRRLFRHQGPAQTAIVGVDDPLAAETASMLEDLADGPRVVRVSRLERQPEGVWVEGGTLFDGIGGEPFAVMDLAGTLAIPGEHNLHNAACAYAAARVTGVEFHSLTASFASFNGLPHRLEHVGTFNGVSFCNDSKATNVASAAAALRCFPKSCWIAGGRAKDEDLDPLIELSKHIACAFFIGEATAVFRQAFEGRVPIVEAGSLEEATVAAFETAWSDPAHPPVLLSPACASFDQFRDFVERGEVFRKAVAALGQGKRA